MTISKVDPLTPVSPSPSIHFLKVGVLRIEGREYTVSVESSDPLIKSPHEDTLDRIRDLVDLHLNHLKQEGVDLSTIVVQQLDEKGLSYAKGSTEKEDMAPMLLSSSEINFKPYNPSYYPKSLQDESILSISEAYRSLIDSLTEKSGSENEEESTIPISKRNLLDENTDFKVKIEQTKPKQIVENSDVKEEDELSESESEDENVGLISGISKGLSQYNPNGIINSIKSHASNFFSRIRNFLPNLRDETNAIDPEKIIAEEESRFRSGLSGSEQATLEKFATIKFE